MPHALFCKIPIFFISHLLSKNKYQCIFHVLAIRNSDWMSYPDWSLLLSWRKTTIRNYDVDRFMKARIRISCQSKNRNEVLHVECKWCCDWQESLTMFGLEVTFITHGKSKEIYCTV